MELDLTPYDKALIIRLLAYGIAKPEYVTDEQAEMLEDVCNALEHCDKVGTTLHIN